MKRGTPNHPKVFDLCDLLRIRRPTAVGYLELLWHFTATFAPDGDIGRFSDRRIEAAVDWIGKSGRLIEALVGTGWLDRQVLATTSTSPRLDLDLTSTSPRLHPDFTRRRLIVHDWCDHADDSVRKRLERAGQQFVSLSVEVTGQNPVSDRDTDRKVSPTQSDKICLPEPCLSLALPEPRLRASVCAPSESAAVDREETPARLNPLETVPRNENGRCSRCNGSGYAHWDADLAGRVYCECWMGRELKRVDARPLAAAVATEEAA